MQLHPAVHVGSSQIDIRKKDGNRIGMISLGLSLFALLLAIFPPCLLGNRILELERICEDHSTAFSFEIKAVRLSFGNENILYMTEAKAGRMEAKKLNRLFQLLTLVMILVAAGAVFTAVYSWMKEHGKKICSWSIITAAVALSWQYVGASIAVGAALLVFIMLAESFG